MGNERRGVPGPSGSTPLATGTLFVVATPIGNLEDITLRAVRVLRESERVLAEDTRRTRVLLSHLGLSTPLVSLHAHTGPGKLDALADELAEGKSYALVTDAGTPLVSDPGFQLVERALARGVRVEAVPGASAVMAALCVAGIAADHFRFAGFLPRSGKRRREALARVASDAAASVLFEAPSRVVDTLRDLRDACGQDRLAAVCRELTKLHEEVARGSLSALCERFTEAPRGEITLVVGGAPADSQADEAPDEEALAARIEAGLAAGQGAKELARELAEALGLAKRDVYQRILAIKGETGP
jgi:16S rRNA (cytidine1402-2'-O)-methyltransferase